MPINVFRLNVCSASESLNAEATLMLMQWGSPLLELGSCRETPLSTSVEAESGEGGGVMQGLVRCLGYRSGPVPVTPLRDQAFPLVALTS